MARYFAVETKCGHVGKDKCIYVWFAVKAESAKEAATKAREYKRVKHHHKDAIREVREISFKEFIELRLLNKNDPYLRCKNVQQQRKVVGLEERIEEDEYLLSKRNSPLPNRCTAYKLKKMVIQLKDVVGQMCDAYLEDIAV